MAARKSPRGKPNAAMVAPQIGSAGLKHRNGNVFEEFLPELRGARGVRMFREMGDNSAEVGSSLGVIRLVGTRALWGFEPYSTDAEDVRRAKWFESCLHDLDRPWASVVRSALTMLQYGFAPHEIVLKVRDGVASKHDDGLIGWAKLGFRPQDSLDPVKPWEITPNGEAVAMYQRNPTTNVVVRIPMAKILNFRPSAGKDNPEGASVLRCVYFTYYFAKRMQETEGIGVERSLNGLPVMTIPAECMDPNADANKQAVFAGAKEIVQNIRNDSDSGVVIGQSYQDGQPLFKFELLSATSSSLPDTSKIIERYQKRIAQALSTDFMMLGHEGVGSYALGDSKLDLFELAVEGYLEFVAEELQSKLIPLTMRVNGWPEDRCPKIRHFPLEKADLARLGDFINKMIQVRVITPDDELEDHVRKQADLPARDPNAKPRELPGATNTKPEGGAPDGGKPPEENPGKEEERASMVSTIEVLAATVGINAGAKDPKFEIHNHLPAPEVHVEAPDVTVHPPEVMVAAPVVNVRNDVQPADVRVENKIPQSAAPIVNVKAADPVAVQKIEIVSLPMPPETVTTVEDRDKDGRVKRTRRKPVK
jgi:hypothetical protein